MLTRRVARCRLFTSGVTIPLELSFFGIWAMKEDVRMRTWQNCGRKREADDGATISERVLSAGTGAWVGRMTGAPAKSD
jgi:hypothetical protein